MSDYYQNDELLARLKENVNGFEAHLKTTDNTIRDTAAEIFRADDKILLGLQRLSGESDLEKLRDNDAEQHVKHLCARHVS